MFVSVLRASCRVEWERANATICHAVSQYTFVTITQKQQPIRGLELPVKSDVDRFDWPDKLAHSWGRGDNRNGYMSLFNVL